MTMLAAATTLDSGLLIADVTHTSNDTKTPRFHCDVVLSKTPRKLSVEDHIVPDAKNSKKSHVNVL